MRERKIFCTATLVLTVAVTCAFKQNDFILIPHHIEVIYTNHSWIGKFVLTNVKPNRTARAFSAEAELKYPLAGDNLKIRVQVYWLLSNEYKKSPILFDIKLCPMLEKRSFGIDDLFVKGNVKKCPIEPGHYFTKNFMVKEEYFPPHLPPGDFMTDVKMILGDITLAETKCFGSIVPKLKLKT